MMAMVAEDSVDAGVGRLRSEFLSLPGMCLTVEQAARLLDVPRSEALETLSALEAEELLVRSPSGSYRRALPLLA